MNPQTPPKNDGTSAPGTYVLLLRSDRPQAIGVGRRGRLEVHPGWYLYVGSAFGPGGVRSRVARHCRGGARRHWHIDYLRSVTSLQVFWYAHVPRQREHDWATAVMKLPGARPVHGFGCSDCRCQSHLACFRRRPDVDDFRDAVGDDVAVASCADLG
jgi:Uri superfamily endonuclease